MCSHFLGKKEHKQEDLTKSEFLIHIDHIVERIKRKTAVVIEDFNKFFAKAEDFYIEYVNVFVHDKKKTIILYVSLVLLTLISFKMVPTGFIPDEDQGVLLASITLPDGASLSRTEEVGLRLIDQIRNLEGVDEKRLMLFGGNGATNTATAIISLDDYADRKISPVDWVKRKIEGRPTDLSHTAILNRIRTIASKTKEASIVVFSPPAISGMSMLGGFEFQMLSQGEYTPQQLESWANKLIQAANQDPSLSSVYTNFQANVPQYTLEIDYEKAMAQSVDLQELYSTLASMLGTYYINDFNKYDRVFKVQMQAESDFRNTASDLSGIYVKNTNGVMVPILSIVKLKQTIGTASITRYNLYKSVQIQGQEAAGKSSGDAMNAMESVARRVLPSDITFDWSGTSAQEREASGQTIIIVTMALVFVYLFLVALYESFTIPIAVLLISPIAALGALIFQMMINQGLPVKEAAVKAAKLRFRAIMMTELAFVIGVLPMLFASGAGANSRISVGSTVFGGMVAAATIGAVLTPAFYVIIQEFVDKFPQQDITEKDLEYAEK